MKTRYTPLLEIKKNDLDRCERDLQQANAAFNNAQVSLKEAYATLESLQIPQHGTIQDMLSARTYISSQRMVVNDKKNWLTFAQNQVELAAQKVKKSNIEYEKFKYFQAYILLF